VRRARYQFGTVELSPRSHGSAIWVYRWREIGPQGKRIRKSAIIGTADDYPTKTQALKAAEGYRLKANREGEQRNEPTFGGLIDRFVDAEKLRELVKQPRFLGVFEEDENFDAEALDSSTASSYLSKLDVHIRPRWGETSLSNVRPGMVEEWLRDLKLAPKTKGHIKALMHRLFEKAMLWELFPLGRNPMELVHVKGISKRTKKPIVLDPDQCWKLISSLPDPYRIMALVAICTGLRVSEILALRWSRIHFDRLSMTVKLKAVNGRTGRVKTDCSEDELPLDPAFAAMLKQWRKKCRKTPGNWVFPSHVTDRCFHASPIQQDYIRPAAERLGLEGVGWHAFRHTYRTWLDEVGAPIGVQQKLMRHAQPSTTMNYGNSQMKAKRTANSKVVRIALRATGRKKRVA
jgi:integrase